LVLGRRRPYIRQPSRDLDSPSGWTPTLLASTSKRNPTRSFHLDKYSNTFPSLPFQLQEVTARLFRYVAVVNVGFNPFGGKPTRGLREFMIRCESPKLQKNHPKLVLNKDIYSEAPDVRKQAELSVFMIDGSEVAFPQGVEGKDVEDIVSEIMRRAAQIEFEYEEAGKALE
jgi:hypothetical protein